MAKVKNKRNSGLADKVHNKRKGNLTKKKLNPFEVHINREKIKVLGKKSKHDRGLPGVSRAKAVQKRKETLGTEMKLMNKTNAFIDKRIGEKSSQMSAEDRMVARFAAERAQQHSRKNIYNLADDEILTHRGQTLEQIEKFDDPRSSDDEDIGEKKFGGLDDDFVAEGHFGGGMLSKVDKDGAKSHKDLIEQLIAESKKRKAEKQKEKEQTLDLTEKLDSEWKDLQPVVFKRARVEEKEGGIDKLLAENEKKNEDYDKMMRELRFDRRGTPSDGLKNDEKQAKEERLRLETLEKERLQRMYGEADDISIAKAKPAAIKHRSADDLDDNFELDDEKEFMLAYDKDGKPLVPEHVLNDFSVPNSKPKFEDGISDTSSEDDGSSEEDDDNDEESESDAESESDEKCQPNNKGDKDEINNSNKSDNTNESDEGNESDDESSESDNNEAENQQATTKQKATLVDPKNDDPSLSKSNEDKMSDRVPNSKPKFDNGVCNTSSEQGDEEEDDEESKSDEKSQPNQKEDKVEINNTNKWDDINLSDDGNESDDESSESDDNEDKITNSQKKQNLFSNDSENIDEENLKLLLADKNPSQQATAIQKLIKKYDPSLAENNKDKLSRLYAHMLQYINDIFTKVDNEGDLLKCFLVFDKLAPLFYDLSHQNKVSTKKLITELLKHNHDAFKNYKKRVPDLDTLIIFKLISILYPTSDYRHPVTTPSLIFISEILANSKFNSAYSLSRGLFLTSLVLEYTAMSKRLVPSAINFIRGVLYLAANTSILNPMQVVPPFKLHRDAKILNLEDDCSKMVVDNKMAVKDLVSKEIDNSFKIRCLLIATLQLREFFNNCNSMEAQQCIFEPHLKLFDRIELELYPKKVRDIVEETTKYMKESLEVKTFTPLTREKVKPKALRLYEPDIQEVFTGSKRGKLSRELATRARLQARVKREMKGATREIRRDKAYVAAVKLKQKIHSDIVRKEKVKQIYKDASIQQGELNQLKRMK